MTTAQTSPIARVRRAYAAGLRPDEHVWVDEWAEANRVLPPDAPEAGPYRSARTPYLIDIQRTMSPASPYKEGWWQKPVQIGGSTSGENMIGAWICAAAGSMLVVFPTLDDAKQWELTRFEPLRAGTRELRRRIRPADEKGSDNTKLRKKYRGGVMRLMGSNRPIKSATIRYAKLEEPDEYVPDINGQGSIIEMVRARLKNFGRRGKLFGDGTPTIEGASAIADQVKRGDQRQWLLYCPDCKHPQRLLWGQLKCTVEGDPQSVRYACSECGALNTEQAWKLPNYSPRTRGMTETQARDAGLAHWVPTAKGEPGVASWVGFNALAAPMGWRPWPELWTEWRAAQGNHELLKAFINNILAETYTDTIRATVGADVLQQRAERYELMTCPVGGLICCASVDTQDNRLEVLLRCWGRGEESWGIWYDQIYGDPALPEVWNKLRDLLTTPVKHASGQQMFVDAAFIDAGGHHGEDVHAFCRDAQLRGKHWFAVRGAKDYYAPRLGKPKKIDFNWRGAEVPGGSVLRFIGTQSIKNLIDARFKIDRPGGGYYHFPLAFTADYYKGLRVEKRERRKDSKGRSELWWINAAGNEPWDLEVYNYAAFLYCMQGAHAETVWRQREQIFGQVRQLDLLNDSAIVLAPAQVPAMPGTDARDDSAQEQGAEQDAQPPEDDDTDTDNDPPAREPATQPPPRIAPAQPAYQQRPTRPRRGGFVNRWR